MRGLIYFITTVRHLSFDRFSFNGCNDFCKGINKIVNNTTQKIKLSIKDFSSNCRKLRIWSHILEKYLMENLIFWAVIQPLPHETYRIQLKIVSKDNKLKNMKD